MKKMILLLGAAAFTFGCAPRPVPPPPAPEFLEHKVTYPGETLGLIARWYTGSAANWQQIAEANPDMEPQRIKTGAIIRIPKALVVKDEPLPRPSRKEAAAQAAAAPAVEGEVKDIPLQPVAVAPAAEPAADPETTDLLERMQKERETGQPAATGESPTTQKSRDEFLKEMLDEALEE